MNKLFSIVLALVILLSLAVPTALAAGTETTAPATDAPTIEPKKSIREKSITCLVCGKTMKVITKKHLALHGLDAVSYREKFGLKKGTPLTCKELQRTRKQKMTEMKLWERRAEKRKIDFGSVEDL